MTDMPKYVEEKCELPTSKRLNLVLVWDLKKLQELLILPPSIRTDELVSDYMASDFVTIYLDYPFDPMQYVILNSKDFSEEANEVRKSLYAEFLEVCSELQEGRVPEAIGVMTPCEITLAPFDGPAYDADEEKRSFGLFLLDPSFLPERSPP